MQSLLAHEPATRLAGRFHRLRSPTQQEQDDDLQMTSGLLLGATPRGGMCPTVQAYFGRLPPGAQGIEFLTATVPHQTGLPDGFGANWYLSNTAFTGAMTKDGRDFAAIAIVVVRRQR